MIWANFLHFYQPPTQKKYWVDRVTDESYRRIVKLLLNNPEVRLTLNVNAVLCDLWRQYGHEDVIAGIKTLVQRGQIELTGSAKFHPLLPKMPKEEIKRQILLNEEGLFEYFGVLPPNGTLVNSLPSRLDRDVGAQRAVPEITGSARTAPTSESTYSPRYLSGFFPPEMAYDRYVASVVAEMGYEWIIAEELSYSHKLGEVKYDRIYEVENINVSKEPLKVFFRDRSFSWRILSGQLGTPTLFVQALGSRFHNNEFLLTAMDGETFGHHRPGMEQQLFEIYKGIDIKSATISELPQMFLKRETTPTLPSTWALMEYEVSINKPFSRWADPDNEIQCLQWELTNLAIETVESSQVDRLSGSQELKTCLPENLNARSLLDRALHSDQYWWASARPWWSLEMIERGAFELLEAIKATVGVERAQPETIAGRARSAPTIIDRAQDLYYRIITTGFAWQRTSHVDELSHQEDETVRMMTDSGLPNLPPEEINKMITTIKEELRRVVVDGEYERAIQLRDRIKELELYKSK